MYVLPIGAVRIKKFDVGGKRFTSHLLCFSPLMQLACSYLRMVY